MMKRYFCALTLFWAIILHGQDSLRIEGQNAKTISEFNHDTIQEFYLITTCSSTGNLRKDANPMSESLILCKQGDTIRLTDFELGYWIVNKGPYFGYINDLFVEENEETLAFKEQLIAKRKIRETEEQIKRLQWYEEKWQKKKILDSINVENYQKQYLEEQELIVKKNNNIVHRYGSEIGNKIINHEFWLGMTRDMAILSLGRPHTINRSIGEWGTNEQWIYYHCYLYFENGILKNATLLKKYSSQN